MSDESDITVTQADRLADAALAIAADDGWRAVSVSAAAERAGVDPAAARRIAFCKAQLLAAMADKIDREALEALDEDARDPSIPMRDRLFEALMARCDVLQQNRDGYRAVLSTLPTDPGSAMGGLPSLARSMARTLEAVGDSPMPPFGPLKVKGLGVVWLSTLRKWMADDSADMAATMKALDGYLARAEELANSFLPGAKRAESPPETDEQPTG